MMTPVKPTVIYGPVTINIAHGGPIVAGWRPAVCPYLALTPSLGTRQRNKWTITHAPTGAAVFQMMTWKRAVAVLRVLIEHPSAPCWGAGSIEAVMVYKDELTPALLAANAVYKGESTPQDKES